MRSKLLLFSLLLSIGFSENLVAQCSITSSINSSALTCGVAPLSGCGGIVYIGDGSAAMVLNMDASLNLTCLGPIQLIVRNAASLDFSPGNSYLTLATGSSLIFMPGAGLIGGSCNASERIYIGTDLLASCNGNGPGADYSFEQLLDQGGYNIVTAKVSPTAVCGSGSFTLTAIPIPASGAAIKWYTVPSGGVSFSSANPYVTPVIASTTTYYVEAYYNSSGFTTPRTSVVATVNPLPSAPVVGTITQPTCALATGSVDLSGLPASGTWTLTRSGTSSATTTGTGTTTTISGLAAGTYTFTVSNGTCTSVASGSVVIVSASAIWNGVSWSVAPSIAKNLVFNGNYSSPGNLSGCSCTVNSGNVVFNAGHTLTVTDAVNVSGGSLNFNNNASLIQVNSVANSGNITYTRNSTPIVSFDYTFWSSPTTGSQTLFNFSPSTLPDKFLTYNNAWAYPNPNVVTFTKGIGYAIRAPQGLSPSVPTVLAHQFVGVPNNGNVTVAVILGPPIANRLLGNPYPSTLDANAFINANVIGTGTINKTISGTLYLWTHNHAISANNYTATDYATYNLSGGTAVSTGTGNTTAPTQYMAAGQGFFIHTVAAGNVDFRNTMRLGTNNTNFYKTSNASKAEEGVVERNRIWLNLTTQNNSNFSQALVGYIEGATNDYNPGYDGLYYGADQFVLYSLINNESYTIQAKALPFSDQDVVPLGFKVNILGALTLSIDHLDGVFAGEQHVYLEDKTLHVIHDLKNAPYSFSSEAGVFNDRFVLRYADPSLQTQDPSNIENGVFIYPSNNEIKMDSKVENIKKYIVYNVLGQVLATNEKVNASQSIVTSIMKNNQTLIVKVTLEDGLVVTRKIIF
ncbi:MAG: T9SS sorting signal type C domain-containing protein [Flavobacterium sp.]